MRTASLQHDSLLTACEGYIAVTGGNVWYRSAGLDKNAIPLLILHGGPGAAHDYLETLEELADQRPVIFYDQLGCGNSQRPDDPQLWTIRRFVEEIAQIRAALQLDQVHILGQSWGALLAVEYMFTRPAGVSSLILAAPCLAAQRWGNDCRAYIRQLPENLRTAIETNEAVGNYGAEDYQHAMMEFYKRHLLRLDPWPECIHRTFAKMSMPIYAHMWGPSEFTINGTLKDYDCLARLGEISVPVLLTCGEFDEAAPATTELYHQQFVHSQLVVFKDASHEHHLEKKDEFNQTLRDFIAGVE